MNISKEARECAETLFRAMENLDRQDDFWIHTPKGFLPANVVVDYGGRQNFLNLLAVHIDVSMQQRERQLREALDFIMRNCELHGHAYEARRKALVALGREETPSLMTPHHTRTRKK